MIEYNGTKLNDGEDREVTRHQIKRITGLSDARLSQLSDEIPELRRGVNGHSHYKLYSLRMVLEYCLSGRLNPKKKQEQTRWQTKANR